MDGGDSSQLPWRFQLEQGLGEVRITWRWLSTKSVVALLAATLWNFYAIQIWLAPNSFVDVVAPLPFRISFATVGVILLYMALTTVLNWTRLTVDRDWLSIEHGPIPWPRPPRIRSTEVEQLYVKASRSELAPEGATSFALNAMLRGGEEKELVSGLDEYSQASQLERRIELLLRIRDRPMSYARR